jgi:hypothetical protein
VAGLIPGSLDPVQLHPAANLFRKQMKSFTFSTGGCVLWSQLA